MFGDGMFEKDHGITGNVENFTAPNVGVSGGSQM